MYKAVLVSVLMLSGVISGRGQSYGDVTFTFLPTVEHESITLEETSYGLPNGDTVAFEVFKCYISGIMFYRGDELVFSEPGSFHLIDAEQVASMSFAVKVPEDIIYSTVKMNIGVDSITSTSGALGGDLDPSRGMFWTWQSGYINMKLEGTSKLCPARKNRFQFHLGGYAQTDNALQRITMNVLPGRDIIIEMPLDKFLSGIDISEQHSIMSPGPEAVALSKRWARLLELKEK